MAPNKHFRIESFQNESFKIVTEPTGDAKSSWPPVVCSVGSDDGEVPGLCWN